MSGYKPAGRHQEQRLTAVTVRNASKPGLYGDGNGLYLRVDRSGARRWIQRIVINGKRRDLGLGSASLVSLAEAREKALDQRKLARAGEDPLALKRNARAIPTFEEAAREVHAQNKIAWTNPKHVRQWLASMTNHVFPRIGSKRIDKITSADILHALDPIWSRSEETARRVKQRIEVVLEWAIARGFRTDNPAAYVGRVLPRHDRSKVRHMLALPYGEVASAIGTVNASKASDATKLTFQLLVHTAVRSGEARKALWSEVDLEQSVWTIAKERTKTKKRPHRVPLSAAVIELLISARSLRRGDTDLVFPSLTGKPLSDMTLSKLMKELGIGAVPHGFRSSFRDWASEQTNHSREVCEFALAHVISDKAEAAYARSDLFEKRRLLMSDWSAFLSGGANKTV